MDILRSNLSKVRIPEPTNRIYKQECCISFDTPMSEGGIFVDLCSFLAFGKDYVGWNYEKTGNPVYLHIIQKEKPIPEDRPLKKPALLGIGINGGFDNQEIEYEEFYSIVVLPDYVSLPFPSVDLPEKVRLAADAIIIAEGAERKQQLASWVDDKKRTSAYALDLKQINSGVVIPSSGWKCCKCDKTDNLWLNLTDGMILCGRKNWDGSGGNNHAIDHYNETKYPLAVKLGTITADLEAADVFSYPEDDSVEDPLLAQHLAFFGIDFSSLQKTEMTTAERELDHNTNFDWNRIQESGQEVEPLFGPGYTGLVNLGNSCYAASTMQVIFSTHSFRQRYYEKQSLRLAFDGAPADPTVDLNTQLTKLGHGLLSGKYSSPMTEKQQGIPPRMFKAVIGATHPEFASMRQQDALEFFLHLLDKVEQANNGKSELDPSRNFRFYIEERLQCPSGMVAYNKRMDYILSLNIPLSEAVNKEQLDAFNKLKAERSLAGIDISSDEIVRPRVPLEACLASFSAPEEVNDFYSTALDAKTTAIKTAGLATFPDYLVLHMRRFVMEEGWVPKKLDVFVDVPDTIDISHMRGKGLQPGEALLPERSAADIKAEPILLSPDESIVSQLVGMGFPHLHCQKAAINTSNGGVEEAMNWLLAHMDDPDIDVPISKDNLNPESLPVDETAVQTLVSFGFQEDIARKALQASGGNIEKATDWIFSHPTSSAEADMQDSNVEDNMISGVAELPDGGGRGLSHVKAVVTEARTITGFIYNHSFLLAAMRRKEYCGGDLIRPGVTRFATHFLALQSLKGKRDGLKKLFAGVEWSSMKESRTTLGAKIEELVNNRSFWDKITNLLKIMEPIVKVLRLVDGDKSPTIPWLYEAIEKLKETIKVVAPRSHAQYLYIIKKRWDNMLMHPLHKAEYKLMAFVSHIGTSTHCGHYVAHVIKDGKWVIFNDTKVGASMDPPKDMGYLYFFERINA